MVAQCTSLMVMDARNAILGVESTKSIPPHIWPLSSAVDAQATRQGEHRLWRILAMMTCPKSGEALCRSVLSATPMHECYRASPIPIVPSLGVDMGEL